MATANIKLTLHLQDGTPIDILVHQEVRAETVLLSALRKIGVREATLHVLLSCFSLQESLDGVSLQPPLRPYDYVLDSLASWRAREASPGVACLYLVLRLVTPGVLGASSSGADVALQHLLFVTSVHSYMGGRLPVSVESAAQLGGILLLVRFGPYDAVRHRTGFCTSGGALPTLVPPELLPRRSPEVWEDLLLSAYAKLGALTNVAVAKELFSGALEELELFGCAHYEARQRFDAALPAALTLCVSCEGVFLADRSPEHPVLQRFPLQSLQLWNGLSDGEGGAGVHGFVQLTLSASAPSSRAWLGLGGAGTQVLSFACPQGGAVAQLMNNYCEQLMKELVEEGKYGRGAGSDSQGGGGGAGAAGQPGSQLAAGGEGGAAAAAPEAAVTAATAAVTAVEGGSGLAAAPASGALQ